MLEKDSLDIIQFELTVVGPTVARQIATLAAAYDKPCVAHVWFRSGRVLRRPSERLVAERGVLRPDVRQRSDLGSVLRAAGARHRARSGACTRTRQRMDKDGYMQLPDAPGLGVTIKKDLPSGCVILRALQIRAAAYEVDQAARIRRNWHRLARRRESPDG